MKELVSLVVTGDAPRCWRSECRSGCHYPTVCSEKQATLPVFDDEGGAA